MPAFYEIQSLPDGPTLHFPGSRGNYYNLDDGTRLDLHTTPIWCRHCATFTQGEDIEPAEEIDQQLSALTSPTTISGMPLLEYRGMPAVQHDKFVQQKRDALLKRKQWRLQRISPPKCIHCGSSDILLLPLDTPTPNPAGPGTVEVTITGTCSTPFNEWSFTPEGTRLLETPHPTHPTNPSQTSAKQNP